MLEEIPSDRIERSTYTLGVCCSVLLSYEGNKFYFSKKLGKVYMDEKQLPFFVYGTLLPAQPNFYLWEDTILEIVPALFPNGRLYDFGTFPMLLPGNGQIVYGRVVTIQPERYHQIIHRLDELESYQPNQPETSIYLRQTHLVQTPTGHTITAWVYVGKESYPAGIPLIPSGDWVQHITNRQTEIKQWWQNFTELFPPSPNLNQ